MLDINKRISSLGIKFSKNLSEENTKLYFAADELAGMPEDFIEGCAGRSSGSYSVAWCGACYCGVMWQAMSASWMFLWQSVHITTMCPPSSTQYLSGGSGE